jgi:glycosyltransferase involved in cell wall biosynthesis
MSRNFTITAHCLVKNEEMYFWYSVKSVIDYVDKVLIFDTGSKDNTPKIALELLQEYPDKITYYKKEECDFIKQNAYKQEMLEMTTTDWFMILDGDEVWTEKGIKEAMDTISLNKDWLDCISADAYTCVGDIFHDHNRKLTAIFNSHVIFRLARFYKINPGMIWLWNQQKVEGYFMRDGRLICDVVEKTLILKNKFWHMTKLRRSYSDDKDFTGNRLTETRKSKRRNTYFIIGERVKEELPEVFDENFKKNNRLGFWKSFFNFWPYFFEKMIRKISNDRS